MPVEEARHKAEPGALEGLGPDQWCLFELQEDGPHSGDVLAVLAVLGVEVAQASHTLPLVPWDIFVTLLNEHCLSLPGG